jgi:hypothetical protein
MEITKAVAFIYLIAGKKKKFHIIFSRCEDAF